MSFKLEALDEVYYSAQDKLGRRIHPSNPIASYAENKIPGRENTRTNLPAYREFLSSESDSFSLIRYMRSAFNYDQLNARNTAILSGGISGLPIYLAANQPEYTTALPPAIIDVSRATQGIFVALASMVGEGTPADKVLTVDEIYEYAAGKNEANFNFFIGPNRTLKESCPAPEGMVKKVLSTMLFKPETTTNEEPDWSEILSLKNREFALIFGYHYWVTRHLDLRDGKESDKWLDYAYRAFTNNH